MSITKRFIAGAVCPRCNSMDSIRVYRNEIREYRECVKCDYQDAQNLDGTPVAEELETRVNQPRDKAQPSKPTNEVQVVKFVANPGLSRKDH